MLCLPKNQANMAKLVTWGSVIIMIEDWFHIECKNKNKVVDVGLCNNDSNRLYMYCYCSEFISNNISVSDHVKA